MKRKNAFFKVILLLSVTIFCLTSFLIPNVSGNSVGVKDGQQNAIMPATDLQKNFVPVQDALQNLTLTAALEAVEPPVRPPDMDPDAWQNYYQNYVAYINQLTDPAMKTSAWKTLLNSLRDMLTDHTSVVTGAAIKAVLDAATAFLNSTDFNGLNNTEKTDYLSAIINTLTIAVNKNSAIDKATLTKALEGVQKFLGTDGWEINAGFGALGAAQKQQLLSSFTALAKAIIDSTSSTIDSQMRCDIFINLARMLTANLREQFRNSSYGVDLTQIKKDIMDIFANYAKSDDFKNLSDGQKLGVIWHFNRVAIELIWRPEDNAANKEFVSKITDFFKRALEVGSTTVQAGTINELTHLFRITSWRNGTVAANILDALNVSGGLSALINKFITDVSNTSLDANLRGDIAVALANLILHRDSINSRPGIQIDAALSEQMVTKVTDYMKGLNDGTINAGWWIRNGLLHIAGGTIGGIIDRGAQNDTLNKTFIDAYLKMAGDSLLLSEAQGGSMDLQTTVINLLTSLRNISVNKGDNALGNRMKNALLDSGFDIDAYITAAKTVMATLVGINADGGAWYAGALINLAQLHLAEGTEKIDAQTLKSILVSVKSWVTNQKNMDDMRDMGMQSWLFQLLKDLAAQIYKKDSSLADDKEMEDAAVDIFSVVLGIKDPKVKELAIKAISVDLVTYLKDNNRQDLAIRIEDIFKG
ncbi:MAG: hypothetical protein V1884_01870 [Candidatus Omnitrophota bacterium]